MNVDYVPVADLTTAAEMIARQKEIRRRQEAAAYKEVATVHRTEEKAVEAAPALSEGAEPNEVISRLPRAIIRRVAAEHGVTYDDIMGRNRFAHIVRARQSAVRAMHEAHPSMGWTRLGQIFGLDHKTVLNAIRGRRQLKKPRKQRMGTLSASADRPEDIISSVAQKYSISAADVTGHVFRETAIRARREAAILVHQSHPDLTRRQIGEMFGNRAPNFFWKAIGRVGAPRTGAAQLSLPPAAHQPEASHSGASA